MELEILFSWNLIFSLFPRPTILFKSDFLYFTFFTQPSILTPSAIKRLSSHQNSPRHIIIFTRVSLETLKLFAFLFLSGVKNRPLSCLWFLPNCYRLNFLLLRKSSTFQPATALISQLPNLNSTLPTFPPCDGYTSFQPGQPPCSYSATPSSSCLNFSYTIVLILIPAWAW